MNKKCGFHQILEIPRLHILGFLDRFSTQNLAESAQRWQDRHIIRTLTTQAHRWLVERMLGRKDAWDMNPCHIDLQQFMQEKQEKHESWVRGFTPHPQWGYPPIWSTLSSVFPRLRPCIRHELSSFFCNSRLPGKLRPTRPQPSAY